MARDPTIILLAFEFPPLGQVGVQRPLKLAKYLPEFGVKPVVVTTDEVSLHAWFGGAEERDLLSELPPGADIRRISCPRPREVRLGRVARRLARFLTVDENIGRWWGRFLLPEWDAIIAETKPVAVWATIPPFSMASLAVRLSKRSGLPLVLDFRDHWSLFCSSGRQTWLHHKLQLLEERRCLMAARKVVCVTRQIVRDLQVAHPRVDRNRFHVIQNGYDGIIPALLSTGGPVVAGNFFVIGYVGAFYYTPETRATVMDPWRKRPMRHWLHYSPRREDWLYRSPYYFFKAMRRMFENHPHLRDRVRVRFVGDKPGWLTEQVEENGLSEVVESLGRLSHRECLKFQANCNALLLTSVKVPGGRDYCIAGKTFEYISAGRPIIAFAAEGEQRDFLESSGTAVLCDPDDADASARALAEMINGVHSLSPNVPFLSGFHRRETARKLAEITLAICPNGGKRPTTEAHHA